MRAFWKWPKMATLQRLYCPCKMLSLVQKLKMPKGCEKRLYEYIRVVWFKKRLEKTLIFEKWERFENGQKWPQCKGYSPCKMLTLGQKLKMPKRCKKRLYQYIRVVWFKKRFQKSINIRKMRAFWEWPKMATMKKGYSPCKMVSLSQKLKCQKGAKNDCTSTLELFGAKTGSKNN